MLLIIVYVIGCAIVTIFQRYLTFHYDTFTQNFYRFLAGSFSLLLISLLFYSEDLKKISRNIKLNGEIVLLAGLFVIAQSFFIEGLSYTSAVVSSFIGTFAFPLTILLAVLFFPGEKEIAKGRNFLPGFLLVFGGTIGFIFGKGNLDLGYSLGVLLIIIGTIIGVFIVLLQKRIVIELNPII